MNGWIHLHRIMLNNPTVCKDGDHLAIWVHLLLYAAHEEHDVMFGGKRITLKSGQLITGRAIIAEKYNISESKVERVLKRFENEQQIEQQTSNKNRIITVVNWAKYQDTFEQSEQQSEQQVNNKWTTSEQQVNTYKKDKKEKNYNNNNNKDICAEQASCSPPSVFIKLLLNDKTEYPINEILVDKLQSIYPAVDVKTELRKMQGWLIGNPRYRKTKQGIMRFITTWLSKEQDKPHIGNNKSSGSNFTEREYSNGQLAEMFKNLHSLDDIDI